MNMFVRPRALKSVSSLKDLVKSVPAPKMHLLETLAPIITDAVRDRETITALGQTVLRHDIGTLAKIQADALDHTIWPATEAYLDENRGWLHRAFKAGDLKDIFMRNVMLFGAMPTQMPLIMPVAGYGREPVNLNVALEGAISALPPLDDFGDSRRILTSYAASCAFGFQRFLKIGPKRRDMVSVSSIGMEPWLLFAFRDYGQIGALRAFQRIVGAVNHDYYHAMTAPTIIPYVDGLYDLKKMPYDVMKHFKYSSMFTAFMWERRAGRGSYRDCGSYELHALRSHADIFNGMMGNLEFVTAMHADIDTYLKGVNAVTKAIRADRDFRQAPERNADFFAMFGGGILVSFLYRVAGKDHRFMKDVVKKLEWLDVDAARARLITHADNGSLGECIASGAIDCIYGYSQAHSERVMRAANTSRKLFRYTLSRAEKGLDAALNSAEYHAARYGPAPVATPA